MITAPTDNIPLPDDIAKAIEVGKNNVTLLISETQRLTRLKGQLEREIGSLNSEKLILEDKEKTLREHCAASSHALSGVSEALGIAQKQLSDTRTEETTIRATLMALNQEIVDKTTQINADLKSIDQKKTKLAESIKNHESDKQDFSQKKSILLDAIKKIS